MMLNTKRTVKVMFLRKAVDVYTGKNSATLGISPTTNKAQNSMANVTIKTRFPYLYLHKITQYLLLLMFQ